MIKIFFFSDTFKHFEEPIYEYQKRLSREVEFIPLKPSKKKDISGIVLEESLILKEKLEKVKGYKILLYIEGKQISTHELSDLIEKKKQEFPDIIFIIGGAYGVDINIVGSLIDMKMSFSCMTFPHSLAYLMLLEQIYRVHMIQKGSGYHH